MTLTFPLMPRLSSVSYIVLGLIEQAGEATPYELHQMSLSLTDLWSVPRAQLYREPERLAKDGLLTERREDSGRRRRRFRLTKAGRHALGEWLATPTTEFTELRDPGLLQLFFGADPEPLARAQLQLHEGKLREYEELEGTWPSGGPEGVRLALGAGIGHEREWARFWRGVLNRRQRRRRDA